MHGPQITMDRLADMVAYYCAGHSIKDTATRFGIDMTTAYGYLRTYGGVMRRRGRRVGARRAGE